MTPGTAESHFAYSTVGVSGSGRGLSSPAVGVNVNGKTLPISHGEAAKLRLDGNQPLEDGMNIMSSRGPLKIQGIRRKTNREVLSVEVGSRVRAALAATSRRVPVDPAAGE